MAQKDTLQNKTATVVNLRFEDCDIRICRPSKWGNPFRIGIDGTREEVIGKYREWLKSQPKLMNQIDELKGKKLGCWCHPDSCHGDVLVEIANRDIIPEPSLSEADWEEYFKEL